MCEFKSYRFDREITASDTTLFPCYTAQRGLLSSLTENDIREHWRETKVKENPNFALCSNNIFTRFDQGWYNNISTDYCNYSFHRCEFFFCFFYQTPIISLHFFYSIGDFLFHSIIKHFGQLSRNWFAPFRGWWMRNFSRSEITVSLFIHLISLLRSLRSLLHSRKSGRKSISPSGYRGNVFLFGRRRKIERTNSTLWSDSRSDIHSSTISNVLKEVTLFTRSVPCSPLTIAAVAAAAAAARFEHVVFIELADKALQMKKERDANCRRADYFY